MMRNSKTHPRIGVDFANKVIEDDVVLRVRPTGLHPFGGCQTALIPTLIIGALAALAAWVFGIPWSMPAIVSGWTFVVFVALYHLWNYRRKRGRHDFVIDKAKRRIHLRDAKSEKRIQFSFDHVERLADTHSYLAGGNLIEEITFDLASEWELDADPPIAGFLKANSHPMSMWCPNRVDSGRFGDVLAQLLGCPITHHE